MKRLLAARLVNGDHDCRIAKSEHLKRNHPGENYRTGASLLDLCYALFLCVEFTRVSPADPLEFLGHVVSPSRRVMLRDSRFHRLVRFDDFLLIGRFRHEWD